MSRLFDRICRVTLTRTVQTESERRFFTQVPNSVEIIDLRIQFEIKKTLGKSPNECKLTITNLAERTRAEVEGPPEGLVATLEAGYDGVARHLFTGDVRLAFSEKKGADWETEFTVADGGRAFARARINHSYRPGTPVLSVLKDAAASMGLALPKEVLADPALRDQLVSGGAFSGFTRDHLTQVLATYGYSWSIQTGRLQILRDEETAGVERAISGGTDGTGMIGSPTFERHKGSKKKGPKTMMKVPALLYPELTPGGTVRVDAREIDGRFKLEKVDHKGDTHGTGNDSWTTSVEAKEL